MNYLEEADKIHNDYVARRITSEAAIVSFLWLFARYLFSAPKTKAGK